MAGTRSSTGDQDLNPGTPEKQSPGQKRKAANSASPQSTRGSKQQKTLEQTAPDDSEMKAAADSIEEENNSRKLDSPHKTANGSQKSGDENEQSTKDPEKDQPQPQAQELGANEHSEERAEKVPSNILEKGIFYFVARGRVGVDNPESVQDFARSYLVLRPLPKDAKLTEGVLEDLGNNRILALPKKVMPKSHRDTFMSFVESAGTSLQYLKDNFMGGSEYNTKTTGVRHSPPVTPLLEGVYAITSTNRTSHFAYIVTIPGEIGEVQADMGFHERGSFVLSVKNPDQQGPANASLPQGPGFPKEIQEEFHGLRWMALQPKHLDYPNAQFLLIGEGRDELGKAAEQTEKDKKHEKESPEEEVQWLENEDSHRTGQLDGNNSVFTDLGISAKDFPGLKSTW